MVDTKSGMERDIKIERKRVANCQIIKRLNSYLKNMIIMMMPSLQCPSLKYKKCKIKT